MLVTRTLAGLERTTSGPVLASMLKRAILRKDPTFSETTYGFRGFGELLRHLEAHHAVALGGGTATGDPEVTFPAGAGDEQRRSSCCARSSPADHEVRPPHLSGLKTQLRKIQPDFSEKRFGYGGFLQFCKAGGRAASSTWSGTPTPTTTSSVRWQPTRRAGCQTGNSDHADVLGFFALPARGRVELHLLALLEGAEARPLDGGVMHEDVVGAFA